MMPAAVLRQAVTFAPVRLIDLHRSPPGPGGGDPQTTEKPCASGSDPVSASSTGDALARLGRDLRSQRDSAGQDVRSRSVRGRRWPARCRARGPPARTCASAGSCSATSRRGCVCIKTGQAGRAAAAIACRSRSATAAAGSAPSASPAWRPRSTIGGLVGAGHLSPRPGSTPPVTPAPRSRPAGRRTAVTVISERLVCPTRARRSQSPSPGDDHADCVDLADQLDEAVGARTRRGRTHAPGVIRRA